MYYKLRKNNEKKRVYGSRKYKKRLISCVIGIFVMFGAGVTTNALLPFTVSVSAEVITNTNLWEKKYVAIHNDNYLNDQEGKAKDAAEISLSEDDISNKIYVTITYNKRGVNSTDDPKNRWNTRNPWFSFAISNGYDLVEENGNNRTYQVLDKDSRQIAEKQVGGTDMTSLKGLFIESGEVGTSGYFGRGKDKVDFRDTVQNGIDTNKLSRYELFNYRTGYVGEGSKVVVKFTLQRNKNYEQGKEFIMAHYFSWDFSQTFKLTSIYKDTASNVFPIKYGYAKDSLEIKKPIKMVYRKNDGTEGYIDINVGRLVDIMETPASRIYVVRGESEHLIPVVPEFVLHTDPEEGIISVNLIEGM